MRSGESKAFLAVAATAIAAVVMLVVGQIAKPWVAGGHGQFHAIFALFFLVPALALSRRRRGVEPLSVPVALGFTILALTQLVEGVGGFGYGPGNDERVNALAQIHDLGLALAPIGLLAGVLGLTVGIAQRLRGRLGTGPALVLTAVVLVGLLVVIAKMIGL
jgi:hypothetical protein